MGGDAYHYHAGWSYILNTDGVAFNVTAEDKYWEIWVDPYMFGDVEDWGMYGADEYLKLGGANERNFSAVITPHAIPEPGTLLLLGMGLLGGGMMIRRRK
jgi:hypothetical protein